MKKPSYYDQIFINCPFDEKFLNMFHAIAFTVLDCGFVPRCSLEIADGTQFRLEAIVNLIEQCRFGIHDLSRVELDEKSRLPRFNMPFELGIFYSAKIFGKGNQKKKKCIILEKCKYRYQKYISDISGIDVSPHRNSIKKCIVAIRNWLVIASRRTTIPPAEDVYSRYLKFQRDIKRICNHAGVGYKSMPFVELTRNMTDWLNLNQVLPKPLFSQSIKKG